MLLPVDEALERVLEGVKSLQAENVPLADADKRVLAASLHALRTQPPFDASAMDGYAVRAADVVQVPADLRVIGESAAGNRFTGRLNPGEAVRIFTGAPVPEGADAILIQENARPERDGRQIQAVATVAKGSHIRRTGLDFIEGGTVLDKGRFLSPAAIGLAAAAGHATVPVVGRPLVAILATGDELVLPGETPGPDQIVASNGFAIAAMAKTEGARILDLGIIADDSAAITKAVVKARDAGAHVLVTLGGASVGARDLVRGALKNAGTVLDFWKIAMRPGKPLMFGRLGNMRVLGLPGNPVSSLVCAHLFLRPLMARLGHRSYTPDLRAAVLASPLKANDERRDYIRASVAAGPDGLIATPFPVQDSSMLTTLAAANALIVREPGAPAAEAGNRCRVLMLG